jgi:hypothetical protein
MNGIRGMKRSSVLLAVLILLLLVTGVQADPTDSVPASPSADYEITWWTVDGGGTTFSENNGYTLGSTAGQPDAAVWGGNGYTLTGGFWSGALVEYSVYLPLVLRDY